MSLKKAVMHPVAKKDRVVKSLERACVFAVMAAIVGCSVPIRHQVYTAPQITGTVVRDGKPVEGFHVQLADVLNPSGELVAASITQQAITDAQGHFALGPITQVAHKVDNPLFKVDQHTVPWGLRLSSDGQAWHTGWVSDPDVFGKVPKALVTAQCDLAVDSKSSVIEGDIANVGNGPCLLKLAVVVKK